MVLRIVGDGVSQPLLQPYKYTTVASAILEQTSRNIFIYRAESQPQTHIRQGDTNTSRLRGEDSLQQLMHFFSFAFLE